MHLVYSPMQPKGSIDLALYTSKFCAMQIWKAYFLVPHSNILSWTTSGKRTRIAQHTINSIASLIQFSFNLPAMLVVRSVMEEFAAVYRKSKPIQRVSIFQWFLHNLKQVSHRSAFRKVYETAIHLQIHKTRFPCNPCRCQVGSPIAQWPWDALGLVWVPSWNEEERP